jgi:dienelactone hydrolase
VPSWFTVVDRFSRAHQCGHGHRRTGRCRVAAAAALAAFACAGGAAEFTRETVAIPLADAAAGAMVAGVFRPSGDGPFPVLVYSHGRAGTPLERSRTRVPDVRGHVRYWLAKGFAVVAPIRPGYGETGGIDREDSGVRYDRFGNCWGRPEFVRSASAAAEAVRATLAWLRHEPWADAGHVVLAGASMGGLASIASAATNPDGVVAYINFSGGTGGSGTRAPEQSCGSAQMRDVMAAYGRTTHVPSLWLYAENDRYWGAEWPRAWHRAYAAAGERTRFVLTAPVADGDGHQLLARGASLWTADVDRFLSELGL